MHADATSTGTTPLLAIESLTKRFAGIVAVDDASFTVARGSITALIGPNGAGKSTLFNVVTGFLRADSGEVRFDGELITNCAPHSIARRGLVRTFQLTKALSVMSVLDNMLLAAPDNPGERLLLAPVRLFWRGAERRARVRALELLEVFGLAAVANDYAGTLSGGQRKLLELARALMLDPTLLLLDEPIAGVNRTLARSLLEHVNALRTDRGVTILLVEHDMEIVMEHSDTVVVMAEGRVVTSGPPAEVQRDPRVVEAYLGSGATVGTDG